MSKGDDGHGDDWVESMAAMVIVMIAIACLYGLYKIIESF